MGRASALAGLPLIALACAGCEEESLPPPPLRPVLVTTVEPVRTQLFGPFASTVEARYQTQLGFQLAGRMVARDVYVGDAVHKGQRLAALDPAVTQFALLRAKADVVNAQAQLSNSEGIEARQRSLAQGGNASQATLDNAVAGRDTAKARLDQTQAALRMAETQVGYTELSANFDAVVTAWTAEVGQYVDTGQAVVTLARPDVREAVVDIPDELIWRVTPGMAFTVRLQAAPGITAQASVREIGPLAEEATRTHRVRLTMADASPAFRLGTTITVSHETEVAPFVQLPASAVVVDGKTPDSAPQSTSGAAYVWLLAADGRRVSRRAVTLAAPDRLSDGSGDVRIAAGLAAGDRVVTMGVHSLSEGQAVAGVTGGVGASALKVGETHL